jgi:periplasmic divalent cation tolerance protein
MLESQPPLHLVITTAATHDDAARIGKILVQEKLAACVTLVPGAESIYHWRGKIENAAETLMLVKTGTEQLAALEARLHQLHNYQTPEFMVLAAEAASRTYLDWLQASLQKT